MPKRISRARFLEGPSATRMRKALAGAKKRTMKALATMRKSGMRTRKSCPPGMKMRVPTMRKAYTKKSGAKVSGTVVPPSCIPRRIVGAQPLQTQPAKAGRGKSSGKRLFVLEDHYLSNFGYVNIVDMTKEARMAALHKLADHFIPIKGKTATWTYIIRALNARYVLNRYTNPKVAAIMKADQKDISRMYRKIKNQK